MTLIDDLERTGLPRRKAERLARAYEREPSVALAIARLVEREPFMGNGSQASFRRSLAGIASNWMDSEKPRTVKPFSKRQERWIS